MKEAGYQSRIIAKIKQGGGHAVNGNFTTAGEADLQCGIPVLIQHPQFDSNNIVTTILVYVAVEVKDEFNYHRVMGAIDEHYNVINKKALKSHEVLQMAKIRAVRKIGGLALVAYNYKQIMEYIDEQFNR